MKLRKRKLLAAGFKVPPYNTAIYVFEEKGCCITLDAEGGVICASGSIYKVLDKLVELA